MLWVEDPQPARKRTAILWWFFGFFVFSLGGIAGGAGATEYTSSSFKVRDPVLQFASTTEMSSTNFRLIGTMGGVAIGTSSATTYKVSSGFLYYPRATKPSVTAAAGNGQVGLYWTFSVGSVGVEVAGYSVGQSTTSGGPYTYTSSVGSTTATLRTGLTNGTIYYFIVRAEDSFANPIATSSEVFATPTANAYSSMVLQYDPTQASTSAVINSNGTRCDLTLPVDLISSGTKLNIEFSSLTEDHVISGKPLPSGFLAANTFYNFAFSNFGTGDSVTTMDKSVTFTFTYTDADVSGVDESTLGIRRWDGSAWATVAGATVDTALNKVTVSTRNFSTFGIFGTALVSGGSGNSGSSSGSKTTTSGGGGGGGGVDDPALSFVSPTRVILKGKAYPRAQVTIFQDGKTVRTITMGEGGDFQEEIKVEGGLYTFSLYAIDSKNQRSLTTSFTTNTPKGITTSISDIVIAPTIGADKAEVKFGNNITFFGYTYPRSSIDVIINSEDTLVEKTIAGIDGIWTHDLKSALLEKGEHTVKSQATTPDGALSPFSENVAFKVGEHDVAPAKRAQIASAVPPASAVVSKNGDINGDERTNIVDFSILLYFWNQRNPKNPAADINRDGIVNLFDFSIMLYWWTG